MSEAPKKLTRVSFVGVSNLPPQKASELGAALQRIVAATAEAHNACDDARIDIDATFRRLGALAELQNVVARVAVLATEEAALGAPTLRAELDAIAQSISHHADALRRGFAVYEEHHPQRGALASGIFQSLLHLAQETIDLLRVSDRGACAKLAALVTAARVAAQDVHDADSVESLQRASNNIRERVASISKRFKWRAELFDDPSFEQKVAKAAQALELATTALLDTKQMTLLSGNNTPITLHDVFNACHVLDEIALCSPEFSLILEVEYFDDNTGINIAALLDATRKGDAQAVVRHTRDLAQHIQALINEGQRSARSLSSPEKEKILKACDDANAALLDVVKTSKQAIEAASSPILRSHLAQQQANAAQRLRKAAAILPTREPFVLVREKRRLAEAARGLMENFASLMAPLTPTLPSSSLPSHQ